MDRLRKAARAAGYVMAGIEHDTGEQTASDGVHPGANAAPNPGLAAPSRPLLLAAPAGATTPTSLWNWLGAIGRGAPA